MAIRPLRSGTVYGNLTVKPARTEQGRVEDIRTVRRRNGDNPFIGAEPIHFDQQLVQCLFPFIMSPAKTGATLAAYGIDFINEHDAGSIFFSLGKQITHTGRTDTDEHFDKVRATDTEKRYACFPGHSPGKQCLTCPRRAKQKDAFRDFSSDIVIFAGIAQEFYDF